MVATLQWIGPPAARRFLWTPDGKLAMAPACCCVKRLCAGCVPEAPAYLNLDIDFFLTGDATHDNCNDINGAYALDYKPELDGYWEDRYGSTGAENICVYRYYFETPRINGQCGGLGIELIDFDAQADVVVYPLGVNSVEPDEPWDWDAINVRSRFWWHGSHGDITDCNNFTIQDHPWTTGNPGGGLAQGLLLSTTEPGFNCAVNSTTTIQVQSPTFVP